MKRDEIATAAMAALIGRGFQSGTPLAEQAKGAAEAAVAFADALLECLDGVRLDISAVSKPKAAAPKTECSLCSLGTAQATTVVRGKMRRIHWVGTMGGYQICGHDAYGPEETPACEWCARGYVPTVETFAWVHRMGTSSQPCAMKKFDAIQERSGEGTPSTDCVGCRVGDAVEWYAGKYFRRNEGGHYPCKRDRGPQA